MKEQWEYNVLEIRPDSTLEQARRMMTDLGREGWEAVSTIDNWAPVPLILFKRPTGKPAVTPKKGG